MQALSDGRVLRQLVLAEKKAGIAFEGSLHQAVALGVEIGRAFSVFIPLQLGDPFRVEIPVHQVADFKAFPFLDSGFHL